MTGEQGDDRWREREKGRRDTDRSAIRLADIVAAERHADRLQAAGVALLQQTLADLAGRRAQSPEEGQEIVERVRHLAKRFGVRLLYDGQPTYLKWARYVFMATTTDSSRGHLGSSAEFLPLTVELPAVEPAGPTQLDGEPHAPRSPGKSRGRR